MAFRSGVSVLIRRLGESCAPRNVVRADSRLQPLAIQPPAELGVSRKGEQRVRVEEVHVGRLDAARARLQPLLH